MKKVFIISLCVMLALSCVAVPVTVYASSFTLPFDEGTVYINYTTADYAPSGAVTAYGGLMYFSEVSGISPMTLLQSYSCYQVVAEKIICINYYGGGYGYILWKDSNGDYQHLMWTIEATDTVFNLDIDSTSAAPAELTGEEFADICARLKEQYAPALNGDYFRISRATDIRWSASNSEYISFYSNEKGFGGKGIYDCYILPFYEAPDGAMWYAPYVMHYYITPTYSEDGTTLQSNKMSFDVLHQFDEVYNFSFTYEYDFVTYKYMDIRFTNWNKYTTACFYETYDAYLSHWPYAYNNSYVWQNLDTLYSTDKLSKVSRNSAIATPFSSTEFTGDMGFICSADPIVMNDFLPGVYPDKIDPDATVKMGGDTIYDYTITNNTTGDTNTFNEYVTNNYTYITNNNGSDDSGNSSGGSVSGDVNVKGEIAVGGQVDVNVNVNNDSDTSSDFLLPADQYAEYLPEVAPEVTEYLERTYSFLPPEVVGLLIGGIGAAVLCRILGR